MEEEQSEVSYEDRRLKNNAAVKRSREKAKKHLDEVFHVIDRLTADNAKLEQNAETLRKEAKLIRAMYSAHIRMGHGLILAEHDLICPDDSAAVAALSRIKKE